MPKYDADRVIYYWTGGREEGEWCTIWVTDGDRTTADRLTALARAGYVAHRGSRVVGAPEGAPSDAEFKALGL